MGCPVAACFDFAVQGCAVTALTFDRDMEAQCFVRDLSVRLRLARTSLKTVREMNSVGILRGQIFTMRRNSLTACAGRWILGFMVCVVALMLFHGGSLYFNEDRALSEVVAQVIGDTAAAFEVLTGTTKMLGSAVCLAADRGRTVPAAAVEACAAMYGAMDAQTCIQELSSRIPLS